MDPTPSSTMNPPPMEKNVRCSIATARRIVRSQPQPVRMLHPRTRRRPSSRAEDADRAPRRTRSTAFPPDQADAIRESAPPSSRSSQDRSSRARSPPGPAAPPDPWRDRFPSMPATRTTPPQLAQRDPSSPASRSPIANRHAARIGPMVCELEGPTPILYRSKRLVVTGVIVVPGTPPRPRISRLRPTGKITTESSRATAVTFCRAHRGIHSRRIHALQGSQRGRVRNRRQPHRG